MLGIRLPEEAEKQLERHARALGRGKSVIAREWILERLREESVNQRLRRASQYFARNEKIDLAAGEVMLAQWLQALDEEDGGFDWGPEGMPTW